MSLSLSIACAALLAALPQGGPAAAGSVPRPRDPWVFRCTLDGRPRSVVVALADDLWVSYDAARGALTKAWSGDVALQGAVYDAVHGPQPVSRGPVWVEGLDGPVWFAEVGGERVELEPRWRGHAFVDGGVELRLEAQLPGGGTVRVAERPERLRTGIPDAFTALICFTRTWRVEAPAGVRVLLRHERLGPDPWPPARGMRAGPGAWEAFIELDSGAAMGDRVEMLYFREPPALGEGTAARAEGEDAQPADREGEGAGQAGQDDREGDR